MATTSIAAVPGMAATSNAFRVALADMADRNGWDADAIAAVMCVETGRVYTPDAGWQLWQPTRTATGLIQFLEATARSLGVQPVTSPPHPELLARGRGQAWATWALMWMSVEQQMLLVERYYQRAFGGRVPSRRVDYYLAVIGGGGLFQPSSTVLYRQGSVEYESNKELDRDKDGAITVADMDRVMPSASGRVPLPGAGQGCPLPVPEQSPPHSGPSLPSLPPRGSLIRVRAGDTPFLLAARYAGNGARWPELMRANPHLRSPRALPIGALIALPANWRP